MAHNQKDPVVAGNIFLLKSQHYSDIIIRCDEDEYKLHRAIICPRSVIFASRCEGESMEPKTATIHLDDDDPQAVKRMFLYLYTQDYPDYGVPNMPEKLVPVSGYAPHLRHKRSIEVVTETQPTEHLEIAKMAASTPFDRMMNNVDVYALADRYHIPDLKTLAKSKFQSLARCKLSLDDFFPLVGAVWWTTPEDDLGLREAVLDICEEQFQDILKSEDPRARVLEIPATGADARSVAVRKLEREQLMLRTKRVGIREKMLEIKAALDRKSEISREMALMYETISPNGQCRACHEEFHWREERSISPDKFGTKLTCVNCGTGFLWLT